MPNQRSGNWRRILASGASLAPVVAVLHTILSAYGGRVGARDLLIGAFCVSPLAIAAAAIWSRRLGAQLLARGCWWCVLVIGTLALVQKTGYDPQNLRLTGALLGVAVALLAVGRSGLKASEGRFQPVAFRGTLMLSLVLAIADGVTLTFLNLGPLIDGDSQASSPVLVAFEALTILGIVGLIRLRTWGLLIALASNVLVGTLALTGALPVDGQIRVLFAATALVQLIVPLPMLVTLIRRRPPPPDRWERFRAVGAQVAILTMGAACVYAGLFRHAAFWGAR
jgi:hypothetical protein